MLRKPILTLALIALLALGASAQQTAPPAIPSPFAESGAKQPRAKKTKVTHRDRIRAQQAFMQGARRLRSDQPRKAMADFARAAKLDPADRRYSVSVEVARDRLVYNLVQQGEKARLLGNLAQATADIDEAYRLEPDNPMVAQHVDALSFAAAPSSPKPRERLAPPVRLQPLPGTHSFHLRADQRTLINEVCAAWGIHPTIDQSVSPAPVPFNIDDATFQQAESALALATNTFFVPLDPVRVLVAKDTRNNRLQYEREATETFYMPSLSSEQLTEMVNLARQDFSVQSIFANPNQHAITIRAAVPDLAAINGTLSSLLKGRSELQLDVSMYEVDRTKATNIGAILPTQTSIFNVYSEAQTLLQQNASLVQQIIASGLAQPGQWAQILAILVASGQVSGSILNSPFATFGGGLTMMGLSPGSATANLQLNSSDVHSVDQIQLRVLDQQEGTIRVGERYPIITSSYGSLSGTPLSIPGISSSGLSSTLQNLGINPAALASATQEIPQIQYQNLGLSLHVRPHVSSSQAVSLKFDLKLTALAGPTLNQLPLLSQRQFQAITTLKPGQSAVLVTSLSRQQSDAITGLPGLSELPGFQYGTDKSSNLNYSELAIVITPHLVRLVHPEEASRMYLVPHAPRQ